MSKTYVMVEENKSGFDRAEPAVNFHREEEKLNKVSLDTETYLNCTTNYNLGGTTNVEKGLNMVVEKLVEDDVLEEKKMINVYGCAYLGNFRNNPFR